MRCGDPDYFLSLYFVIVVVYNQDLFLNHTFYSAQWEALYTEILEVNLFAFAYRLFPEDFSSLDGAWVSH